MKKIIVLLIMLFSVNVCNAQRFEYVAHSLSLKLYRGYRWTNWHHERTRTRIIVDIPSARITIFSRRIQIYSIISKDSHYFDLDGADCFEFTVIDQDSDIGTLILRNYRDRSQICIRFFDVQWIYHV
jgi:hypothetical protein